MPNNYKIKNSYFHHYSKTFILTNNIYFHKKTQTFNLPPSPHTHIPIQNLSKIKFSHANISHNIYYYKIYVNFILANFLKIPPIWSSLIYNSFFSLFSKLFLCFQSSCFPLSCYFHKFNTKHQIPKPFL
jgi:hypothetical protein